MGFSLNLKIRNASASTVTALWDLVGAFEGKSSMRALGYPPHFTFAIYDTDEVSDDLRLAAIKQAAAGEAALHLEFNSIRMFAGPPLVLWADPGPQEQLMQMHAAVHAIIDPQLCRPHYRPRSWVPHCTLGMAVRADHRNAALAFAENFRGGVEAIFDVIDCVTFPPLCVTAEKRLPTPA
jgi:2'-5' RNA ligase